MLIQIKSTIPPQGVTETTTTSDPFLVSSTEFSARKLGSLWVYEPHSVGTISMEAPTHLLGSETNITPCCHIEEKWDPILGCSVIICSVQGKPLKPYYISYGMHGKPYSAMFSLSYPFVRIMCDAFYHIRVDYITPTLEGDSIDGPCRAFIDISSIISGPATIKTVYCKQHGVVLDAYTGEHPLQDHLLNEHANTPWRPNHDIVISEFDGIPEIYQFAVRAAVRSMILNVSHHAVRPFFARSANGEYRGSEEDSEE